MMNHSSLSVSLLYVFFSFFLFYLSLPSLFSDPLLYCMGWVFVPILGHLPRNGGCGNGFESHYLSFHQQGRNRSAVCWQFVFMCRVHIMLTHEYSTIQINTNTTCLLNGSFLNLNMTHLLNEVNRVELFRQVIQHLC